MQEEKKKIRCLECSAAFMIKMSSIPDHVTEMSCSKCGAKIPLLDRVIPNPSEDASEEASDKTKKSKENQGEVNEEDGESILAGGAAVEGEGEDDSAWLAIYGDMMSLLLVFFVLLFAISTVDKQKFEVAIGSISSALGGPGAAAIAFKEIKSEADKPIQELKISFTEQQKADRFSDILAELEAEQLTLTQTKNDLQLLIESYELSDEFELIDETDALVLVARDASMFASGSDELSEKYANSLWEIGHTLAQLPNKVVIEGHTDNKPISTIRFPSNWELSTARATSVVRLFIDKAEFDPRRISGAGVAFYKPRYPLVGEKAHMNRRIEIRVMRRYPEEVLGDMLNKRDGLGN